MSKYYAIQQAGKEANLYIFGDLVPWKQVEGETSAYSFREDIAGLNADVIHVHINSYGGAVSEGWAIYNTLREHPARIVTHADGFVASAAIYPFMAGNERLASNLSAFFFHQVLMGVVGNADELRAAADEAEKINDIGLAAFENAGIDPETVKALEKAETWMDAGEALSYGFATAVVSDAAPKVMQSVKAGILLTILNQRRGRTENLPNEESASEQEPERDIKESKPNSILELFKNF